jgi:hypothetical protein
MFYFTGIYYYNIKASTAYVARTNTRGMNDSERDQGVTHKRYE